MVSPTPGNVLPTAFINYRRQDSDASAGHLYDSLTTRLPDLRVFMDVDAVKGGEDFTSALATTLSSSDVLLAVIGPGWVTARKSDGTRRLDDPGDFVIMEIAEALKRNVAVMPVLVQGAAMPSASELPPQIQDLAKRQAMVLSNASWNPDVDALVERIETLLAERAASADADAAAGRWSRFDRFRRRLIPRTRTWRWVSRVILLLAALALIVGGYASFEYVRGANRRALERIAVDFRYELPPDAVTAAIVSLQQLAVRSKDPRFIDLAAGKLKALAVNGADTTDNGRLIRRRALEAIKMLRQNDLTRDFGGIDLKKADLVDVDLSRAVMKGLNLEGAFLLWTNFSAADLTGTNLSLTFVRNTDFSAATLTAAKVEDMDWFNAEGFDPSQLHAVDLATLAPCPKDGSGKFTEAAFRARLSKEYAFKWEQLGSSRTQLLRVWTEYSKPGGLCEQVDSWLASR